VFDLIFVVLPRHSSDFPVVNVTLEMFLRRYITPTFLVMLHQFYVYSLNEIRICSLAMGLAILCSSL
jgi:hypothetical protein